MMEWMDRDGRQKKQERLEVQKMAENRSNESNLEEGELPPTPNDSFNSSIFNYSIQMEETENDGNLYNMHTNALIDNGNQRSFLDYAQWRSEVLAQQGIHVPNRPAAPDPRLEGRRRIAANPQLQAADPRLQPRAAPAIQRHLNRLERAEFGTGGNAIPLGNQGRDRPPTPFPRPPTPFPNGPILPHYRMNRLAMRPMPYPMPLMASTPYGSRYLNRNIIRYPPPFRGPANGTPTRPVQGMPPRFRAPYFVAPRLPGAQPDVPMSPQPGPSSAPRQFWPY